jgi:hypothetical protein
MSKKKRIDLLPDEFSSYEEAGDFWDTHDTTDYLDAFHTIETKTELKHRYYEVEVDEDLAKMLRIQASQTGTTVSRLISELLRQQVNKEVTKSA